jgi:hypothetical protein
MSSRLLNRGWEAKRKHYEDFRNKLKEIVERYEQ